MSGQRKECKEKAERLVDLLEWLPDELLEEAAQTETRQDFERLAGTAKPKGVSFYAWKRFSVCAACLCLLLVGLAVWRPQLDGGQGMDGGALETTIGGIRETTAAASGGAQPTAAAAGGADGSDSGGGQGDGAENGISPTAAPADGGMPQGNIDLAKGGFWYGSCRYVESGEAVLSALPENYEPAGTLHLAGEADGGDWETWDESLNGCQVYAGTEESAGTDLSGEIILYVAKDDGYHACRPAGEVSGPEESR